MAKRKLEEVDGLTCRVCYKRFSEPKILLPCMHRFCKTCLHEYITTKAEQGPDNITSFPCPLCEEETFAPIPDSPHSEWASLFTTDYLLKRIIRESTEEPRMKNPCLTHPDIEYDYYCVDCSVILCHKCVMKSHRQCGEVATLTDAAGDRRAALKAAIENEQTLTEESTKCEVFCNTKKEVTERERNKVAAEIQTWSQQSQQHIQQEEARLLAQLAVKCNCLRHAVNSAGVEIQMMKEQSQRRLDQATSKLSLTNTELMVDKSVLDIIRDCQQVNAAKAVEDIGKACNDISNVTFTFHKIPFPAFLGGIVESCNDNSIVTADQLSHVSHIKPEMSTSSGTFPIMTNNAHLKTTDMTNNAHLKTTDMTNNAHWKTTDMTNNAQLKTTDMTNNAHLKTTDMTNNAQLKTTDMTKNAHLKTTIMTNNAHLKPTDMTNNAHLKTTDMTNNAHLKTTDMTNNAQLKTADMTKNAHVKTTDRTKNAHLKTTNMTNNAHLKPTDMTNNAHLKTTDMTKNAHLKTTDMTNNVHLKTTDMNKPGKRRDETARRNSTHTTTRK